MAKYRAFALIEERFPQQTRTGLCEARPHGFKLDSNPHNSQPPPIDSDVSNFRMIFEKCYEDALEAPSSFT
jgi:hypothetical protein